jgi:4-amino-4-deoxy-L-arabinose transferase-like glycosyltransferase
MKKLARLGWWLLPLLVLGVVMLNHLAWLEFHTAVETWDDDAGLFRLSMCLADAASDGAVPCAVGAPYPPLVPWISAKVYSVFGGASLRLALLSLSPFLVLLCGALYMGFRRAVSPMAGLAAMALGPVMLWSLHIRGKYYTEVPLAALVVAAVVALAASETFRRRLPSLLFGLFLGLGLLAKWSFAFFLGPVATIAIGIASARLMQRFWLGALVAFLAVLVPVLVLAGAAGWMRLGLSAGFWLGLSLCSVLAVLNRYRPSLFVDGAAGRMVNIGLVVIVTVLISGPWYWHYLPAMSEFLAANLAQKFHGDPVSGLDAWPFYPAVLFSRLMTTPTVILSLLAGLMALRPKASPLLRWSVLTLVCGVLILGLLPYRSGRYLIAGAGLLGVIALWPLTLHSAHRSWVLPLVLATGLAQQLSWIPLAFGGVRVPHHLALFTLPQPDLMGNTVGGIYQAYQDLLHPRWRFLPFASPPVRGVARSEWVAVSVMSQAKGEASLLVVVDPAQRLNLNAVSTHLTALRPPPTTKVVGANGALNAQTLSLWARRAARPRDQPATSSGPPQPRRLFLVLSYSPRVGPSSQDVAALKALDFKLVAQSGALDQMGAIGLSIWRGTQR